MYIMYIYVYAIYTQCVYTIYNMYMYIFKFPLNPLVALMCKEEALHFMLWLTPCITKSPGPLAGEAGE